MVREVKSFEGNQRTGEKQKRRMEKDKVKRDVDHRGLAEMFAVLSLGAPHTNPTKPFSV